MKKVARRLGAVFIILLFAGLAGNYGLFYGAHLGYGMGYQDGAADMYTSLVHKA